ncbi:MAG: division/cell wall cluster transcriptional repressor MraZ [Deltaproteobacteria bacterium]|nr:division/cell wall cluster transcriptional repressor MraZ [Deltaproteobacteria bacterium]
MFRGRFKHTIDAKGRLSIPSRFRDVLREKYNDERLIITNLDGCLVAYPFKEWGILEQKASNLSMFKKEVKAFLRFFYSGATECFIDKLGRILIPPVLRDYAKLEKEVVLVGALKKVEIWSKARWEEVVARSPEDFDDVSEVLAGLGL